MFARRRNSTQLDEWADQLEDVKATIVAIDKELSEIRATLTQFAVKAEDPDTESMARWLSAATDLWITTEREKGSKRGRGKRRR